MRRIIDNDHLVLVIRLVVGITMIYASLYKVIDPGSFARSIWYYHMVPGSLINLMAIVLPWVELICGVFMIIGVYYRGAVFLINLMMVMFILALSSAIARGINIDCGCFKAAEASSESAWQALYFDLVMFPFTLWLFFSRSCRWMVAKR